MVVDSYMVTNAQHQLGCATITKTANKYHLTVVMGKTVTREFSSMERLNEYVVDNFSRADGKEIPHKKKLTKAQRAEKVAVLREKVDEDNKKQCAAHKIKASGIEIR